MTMKPINFSLRVGQTQTVTVFRVSLYSSESIFYHYHNYSAEVFVSG